MNKKLMLSIIFSALSATVMAEDSGVVASTVKQEIVATECPEVSIKVNLTPVVDILKSIVAARNGFAEMQFPVGDLVSECKKHCGYAVGTFEKLVRDDLSKMTALEFIELNSTKCGGILYIARLLEKIAKQPQKVSVTFSQERSESKAEQQTTK